MATTTGVYDARLGNVQCLECRNYGGVHDSNCPQLTPRGSDAWKRFEEGFDIGLKDNSEMQQPTDPVALLGWNKGRAWREYSENVSWYDYYELD